MSRSTTRTSITLIFASRVPFAPPSCLTRRRFRLRHRHPLGVTARSERANCSSPPRDPPHPQSIRHPERNCHCSTCPRKSSHRESVEEMDPAFANILKRFSSSASLQKSSMRRTLSKATCSGTFLRRRNGAAYQKPDPLRLLVNQNFWRLSWVSEWNSTDEIDLTPLNEENNTVETTEVAIQKECEEPIVRAPRSPPAPTRVHPPTSEMAVQMDPEPELRPLTVDSEAQTLLEVLSVLSDAVIQRSPAPPSVKDTGIQTIHAARSEMETQTPRFLTAKAETQTPKPPSLSLDSVGSLASPVPRSSCSTITLSNASRSAVNPGSLPGALYRKDSGEGTIAYGRPFYRTDDGDEDDGNKTETGVETETDPDDCQEREPASEWPPPIIRPAKTTSTPP